MSLTRDKSNDLVTVCCPACDSPKEVKRGREERTTISKPCGEQMLDKTSYLIEKNNRKNNKIELVK